MKKIFILLAVTLSDGIRTPSFSGELVEGSFSQTDSLSSKAKAKFMPAIKVGGNYVGFFNGEAGFLFGMTRKNLTNASKVTSTMCHGPALNCEIGKPNDTILIAPKISYEYYSVFYGARLSVVDYMNMKANTHNIYISPEFGISGGAFINVFAGVNIPVSGKISEVNTLRVSLTINLFSYLFKKDKPKS